MHYLVPLEISNIVTVFFLCTSTDVDIQPADTYKYVFSGPLGDDLYSS